MKEMLTDGRIIYTDILCPYCDSNRLTNIAHEPGCPYAHIQLLNENTLVSYDYSYR